MYNIDNNRKKIELLEFCVACHLNFQPVRVPINIKSIKRLLLCGVCFPDIQIFQSLSVGV